MGWRLFVIIVATCWGAVGVSQEYGVNPPDQTGNLVQVIAWKGRLYTVVRPSTARGTCRVLDVWLNVPEMMRSHTVNGQKWRWNAWCLSDGALVYERVLMDEFVEVGYGTGSFTMRMPLEWLDLDEQMTLKVFGEAKVTGSPLAFLGHRVHEEKNGPIYFCMMRDKEGLIEFWGAVAGRVEQRVLEDKSWRKRAAFEGSLRCPFQVFQVGDNKVTITSDFGIYVVGDGKIVKVGPLVKESGTVERGRSGVASTMSATAPAGSKGTTGPAEGELVMLYDVEAAELALLEWKDGQLARLHVEGKDAIGKARLLAGDKAEKTLKSLRALLEEKDRMTGMKERGGAATREGAPTSAPGGGTGTPERQGPGI